MSRGKNLTYCVFAVALVLSTACANKSYLLRNSQAQLGPWKSLAVLPCVGPNAGHNQVATDLLQMLLLKQQQYKIIEPKVVYTRSKEQMSKFEDGVLSQEEAVSLARKVNADAAIHCTITSHHTDGMMNGFATLKLLDVRTGDLVATSHEPSGLLFAYSVEQCVHAATENSAENILKVLEEIAHDNRKS